MIFQVSLNPLTMLIVKKIVDASTAEVRGMFDKAAGTAQSTSTIVDSEWQGEMMRLLKKLDGRLGHMEEGFAGMKDRMAGMEERMAEMEERMATMASERMVEMEERMVSMEGIMAAIEKWATTTFGPAEDDSEDEEADTHGRRVPIQSASSPTSPPSTGFVSRRTSPGTQAISSPQTQASRLPAGTQAGRPAAAAATSTTVPTTQGTQASTSTLAVPQSSPPGLSIISPTPYSSQEATAMDIVADLDLLHVPGQDVTQGPRGMKRGRDGESGDESEKKRRATP